MSFMFVCNFCMNSTRTFYCSINCSHYYSKKKKKNVSNIEVSKLFKKYKER